MASRSTDISLLNSLLFKVMPTVILMLFIAAGLAVSLLTSITMERAESFFRDRQEYSKKQVQQRLDNIKDTIEIIAANDLLLNSLIDFTTRNQYLPIFFGSLRTPGASDGQIVMVDYRGRQLISNQLEAIPENEALLLGVINEGKTYFHVNTERLIYVVPICYHNLPEGALYVTYQREQFAQLFGLAKDGDYMIVLNESNQVVYSTYPQEQKILPWDEQLDNWLVATEELRGAGGIKIVTGVSKDTAFAGVRNIKNILLAAMGMLLLLFLISLVLLTKTVSTQVKKLVTGIQSITDQGNLSSKIDFKGPKELGVIADSFNTLMNRLNETMIDRTHLLQVFNSMAAGVLVVENNTKIILANEALTSFLGCSQKDITNRSITNYFDDYSCQQISRIGEDESTVSKELVIRNKNDREVTVLLSGASIPAAGDTGMFVCVIQDITKRKQMEKEIEAQRQRLDFVIQATQVGLWDWNIHTDETVFNERWAEIVGYTLQELEPTSIATWSRLTHPDDLAAATHQLKRHFNGELPYYKSECRMKHKSGHWVWVLDRGMVVAWDEAGNPLRMTGTHTDVTVRRKAEDELQSLHDDLEQRISQRTRQLELAQSQLVMQEKMASVGLLAAGIAHELNNPINFIRTNFASLENDFQYIIEVLRAYQQLLPDIEENEKFHEGIKSILDKERKFHLNNIIEDIPNLFSESEEGFNRAVRIINSMRNFSYVDQKGSWIYFDINKGISDTLVIAKSVYKYYASIQTDYGKISKILCLPEQINQVLLNLIVNSAQAIASQGRKEKGLISIKTRQHDGSTFCIISDDGPGIPEKHRNRIFEPFFTTKDPGKGTGLGLSISYDIVASKHNGHLSVFCPETGGTVFTIQLPNKQEKEVPEHPAEI